MSSGFLLYGANGFVGDAIARMAVQRGFKPVLAGRNAARVQALAAELGLESRVFSLKDPKAMDAALAEVAVVLHCAGPFIHTFKPMMEGCLRTGTHYLDLTGEIPVYQGLADGDAEAKARHVMLMPGVGFDVVPTDCLALHLKQRLPGATRLALAFMSRGPAGLPPGTQKTSIESSAFGGRVRRNGQLVPFPAERETRMVDFGRGPVEAMLFPWG
ncbi:MAG: saccharopine dehydrogenase family protein, partial [Acidobacteriota bacterium]